MAEWVVGGIGRDIGLTRIHELVSFYYEDSDEQRRVEELLALVFEKPTDSEIGYVYRLLSSSFLLSSVKIDPSAVKFLKESISEYELFLDSNVLLPLVIKEHKDHGWISSIVNNSRDAGAKLFATEDIVNELFGHRNIAKQIIDTYGHDLDGLSVYARVSGRRANCFIQGFLNVADGKNISAGSYLAGYNESKMQSLFNALEITTVRVTARDLDPDHYREVLAAITREWASKFYYNISRPDTGATRPAILNENEAKQFLYLYARRRERADKDNTDNTWFLSFEAVLERVYLKDPQAWGKPPTFPVSAWASFLDSRLVSEPIDRRDILNAIIKGNSTTYALPDSVALVRKRTFGDRVLSKIEFDAVRTSLSNALFFGQLEKARDAVVRRSQKNIAVSQEFLRLEEESISKVKENLNEEFDRLKKQLQDSETNSDKIVASLNKQLQELKSELNRRRRRKQRQK